MRKTLLKIVAFILALDAVFVSPRLGELIAEVDPLVAAEDAERSKAPGEFRRHNVYGAMVKRHPGTPRFLLGLAIELAVAARR